MTRTPFSLKTLLIGSLALLIVGYTIFNSRFLIQGPEIVLENIEDSIVTQDKTLFLTGKILHSSFITINGRPIFIDEHGNFNEKLLLSSGVSIIDIYAKDKFGKEVRRKIDVLYRGNPEPVDLEKVAMVAFAEASASGTSTEDIALAKASMEASADETATASSTPSQDEVPMTLMTSSSTTTAER
jgi:hypothetical protein